MADDGKTTLTIHGLDEDNKLVRAEVFGQKLQALVSGLRAADKHVNGRLSHNYIITELDVSSVVAQIKEIRKTRKPAQSSIAAYESGLRSVYQGDSAVSRLPKKLVRSIAALSNGAAKNFAHAEIGDEPENLVRIDDYLLRQAQRAERVVEEATEQARTRYYEGVAQGSFDGILELLDGRGTAILAKLIATAGRHEIDCVVNRTRIPNLGDFFEQRVRLEGTAHYEAHQAIPVRIDVSEIRLIKKNADLIRWRGAFAPRQDNGTR